ncbi:MAG: 30S ribosomal protein S6 [Candidatus Magasanikbacteria bacterium GW2011_GWD2_43_18]|uniref:Small ribosomal subunit protein bS6 n=1 Tax=Candidatus Magasanikbacteria bacterium GW2011_GWE2_42_7 TaxID=1619052 RepID=A0A0G1E775_9BACT|nr:MAG: 30S ribosomal protein S6 [Candidatus Magasanikbacteria bacterium GW2011_GWC2_42_27]KKS70413.1 MAG: 30S ribosomal protein S6 [Candidatus Magasanikbacteria bacterium GW2011_GWE2_42_7]KKT04798.1 MAG: 30S ribosomal protein S6 [Candidatus Magasanikbacteria bacterium GW2011_GWD2_43_18]KKT25842.1 MAG: 30S ribosomal protein S6 [Candidatus Magasanikbacteria bacterium GW2011_GWA2_43_9]HBB37825.1 30S ribosomal protein S6 [Candidatus Magasanikbacteria bacterium]
MKQYELLLVLPGTMDETTVSTMAGEVKAVVEKHGGEQITMQDRGKSRLAYPIQHIRYGYFHIIHFTTENGAVIPEIQKELSLLRDVLRAVITTFDPKMRAETQKKLGRTQVGPLKTLSSVFERFGGDTKTSESEEEKPVRKEKEEVSEEKSTPEEPVAIPEEKAPVEEVEPIAMEDIDKKLDQLLEDDLKQV